MRKLLFISLLFLFPGWSAAQEEIVIEMQGDPTPAAQHALWTQNARRLTRTWRGKTREQLLYAMPVVSDRDDIVRNPVKEYALVQYQNGAQFRKFLFRAETPQTFVAAAATAADVLAINKKYAVNIGLTQEAFESAYAAKARRETPQALPEQSALYRLSYTDVNTPQAQTRWFLFEKGQLSQTFESAAEKDAYLARLKSAAQPNAQTPAPAAQPPAKPVPSARRATQRPVRKALVSGGTAHDQAYMPRLISQPISRNPAFQQKTN